MAFPNSKTSFTTVENAISGDLDSGTDVGATLLNAYATALTNIENTLGLNTDNELLGGYGDLAAYLTAQFATLVALDEDFLVEHAADGTHKAITFLTSITTPDGAWIGLGAAKGRIVFDDQTLDAINFWDCRVGIGIGSGLDPRTGLSVLGDIDIIHIATEADDHTLELDVDAAGHGDVKAVDIDYITGAISAGKDEGVILINIDEIAATGGDVFGIEILATDGGATIYGLKAGALVSPIHQDSGTFANPTTGTDNTPFTDVPAMIDGAVGTTTAIFEADDEYIIIGAAAAFQEIEFILATASSNPGIKPTFWYSTVGTHQFTQFTPVDGTNGFRNTGVVAWDASDLAGHVADDVTLTFDIKIIRTQNSLGTEPVLGYAKVAITTEYIWDKSGNVNIKSLTASSTVATDTIAETTGAAGVTIDSCLIKDGYVKQVDPNAAWGGNLMRNFPALEAVDGATPDWWNVTNDEAITNEDAAGEGIPQKHLRVYKVTMSADGGGADFIYQDFDEADEGLLDDNVTKVSAGVWVYLKSTDTSGTITLELYDVDGAGSLGTDTTTAEDAWAFLSIEDKTYQDSMRWRVGHSEHNAVFYICMPMLNVGSRVRPWQERGTRRTPIADTEVYSADPADANYNDLDLNAVGTKLTVMFELLVGVWHNDNAGYDIYIRRNGSALNGLALWAAAHDLTEHGSSVVLTVQCDAAQTIEHKVSNAGVDTLTIVMRARWDWE